MNSRTLILILAAVLIGAGLIYLVAGMFEGETVVREMTPAVAAAQIEPYTVITQDMVKAGQPTGETDAFDRGLWPVDKVVGLMTTNQIKPGDAFNAVNAKPIEQVRFARDLGLEIVTFQAGVDKTVGGQLRPGHVINLYGYGKDPETKKDFTELIEKQIWVVKVSAGGQPVTNATPRPNEEGVYTEEGGDRETPSSLITVAVRPDQAVNIVNSLGARGLQAWTTLAANQSADIAQATPVMTAAPPATAGLPPDLAGTATALWNLINATPPAKPPRTGYGGSR